MSNIITQEDIDLALQRNKLIKMKVKLLDENYQEVDNLTGKIVPTPSYDIDSESDIRRTCSLTLSIPLKEQIDLDFEKTWNKRMVELMCGIYSNARQDYKWYNLGRMLMTSGSSRLGATSQEVSLNLVDLMSSMTQEGGKQIGYPVVIEANTVTKNAIKSIVEEFSDFKHTDICDFPDVIPYDLKSDSGVYPIDLLKSVLDLFPTYEMYYDNDGTFITREIPTKIEDAVDVGVDIIDPLLISENKNVNFAEVKNTTEIWGAELHGDYMASSCESVNGRYDVFIDDSFETLESGKTYTVVPDVNSVANQTMKIQDTDECAIVIAKDTPEGIIEYIQIQEGAMKEKTPYVLKYLMADEGDSNGKFVLQGELYIRVIVQEINEMPSASQQAQYMNDNACKNVEWRVTPDNPFACYIRVGIIEGERRQVLKDGDYSKIYTTELAYERARYENWMACRMKDTVELEMMLIPWMDMNDKIQYTSPVDGTIGTWLVNSISYDFSNWTMTVNASRFYETYPF